MQANDHHDMPNVNNNGNYIVVQMEDEHSFTQVMKGAISRDWLLLQSQSTCNMLCNLLYATNIWKFPHMIHVHSSTWTS